jgi:formiminoglutamase
MTSFVFKPLSIIDLNSNISKRKGEKKLGENINLDPFDKEVKYVILGIEEDLGPQCNYGLPGSRDAFQVFLPRFLSMQHNEFINPREISILGRIEQNALFTDVIDDRLKIELLDQLVHETLLPYIEAGKVPIVIGGGHNNCYPIIKSISAARKEAINVINIDPHADFRALEGRHSGNGFSYAFDHGYLKKYSVFGLHKAYNSEYLINELKKNAFEFTFFDDYLVGKKDFSVDIANYTHQAIGGTFGIEIDLDCIAQMPSSAFTPSGFEVNEIRKAIHLLKQNKNILYLHLPEGAPYDNATDKMVGKTLAYLVYDFIASE